MKKEKKPLNTLDVSNVPLSETQTENIPLSSHPVTNQFRLNERSYNKLLEEANKPRELQEGISGFFGVSKPSEKFGQAGWGESLEATWTQVKDTTLTTELFRRAGERQGLEIINRDIIESFDDNNFLKQEYLKALDMRGDPKNALTAEQIKTDPDLYREELFKQFDPKENLNYEMYKARVERYDERQRAKLIQERQSGGMKLAMFIPMMAENLVVDAPLNLLTGGVATATAKTLGTTAFRATLVGGLVGGTENVVQGELIEAFTEDRMEKEGEPEKTKGQRNMERLFDFGFGAVIGSPAGYFGYKKGMTQPPSTTEKSDIATDIMQVKEKIEGILTLDKETIAENQTPQLKSFNVKDEEGTIYQMPTDFKVHGTDKRIFVDYEVRELSDILKNGDEGYPDLLKTSKPTILEDIPFTATDFLISRDIQTGSPLITENGIVINGNKRLNFLESNFKGNTDEIKAYVQTMKNSFPQHKPEMMRNPVLVRKVRGDLSNSDLEAILKASNTPDPVLSSPEFKAINETYNNRMLEDLYINKTPENESLLNILNNATSKASEVRTLINDAKLPNNADIRQNIADAFIIQGYLKEKELDVNLIFNNKNQTLRLMVDPITESIVRSFYKNEANMQGLLPEAKINKIFDDFYNRIKDLNLESDVDMLNLFEDVKKQNKKQIVSAVRDTTPLNTFDKGFVSEGDLFSEKEIENLVSDKLKQEAKDLNAKNKLEQEQGMNIINCLFNI